MSEFYCNKKVRQYAVSPGGKALYNDSTRFGTKMLEKMGWTKGKGLGANLDGSQEFVRVRHKDDNKGMGFHDRDDQWTQHEQNFNALLKSFETPGAASADGDAKTNGIDANANDDESAAAACTGFGFKQPKAAAAELLTKEKVFSGVSLEAQSAKSGKRVHYAKRVRGKDMARYSEQDLANIFGKKALNDQHTFVPPEAFVADDDDEDGEAEKKSAVPTEEHVFGVTVIKTGTTVNDYFKAKMEALQARRKGPNNEGASNPFYVYQPEKVVLDFKKEADEEEEAVEELAPKKQKKAKKSKREVDEPSEETNSVDVQESVPIEKKSKKSKNQSQTGDESEQTALVETTNEPTVEESAPKKKKKAKKSKCSDTEEINEKDTSHNSLDLVISSKTAPISDILDENAEIPSHVGTEKKSKRKRKHDADANESAVLTEEPLNVPLSTADDVGTKKKSKKSKKHDTENTVAVEEPATAEAADAEPPRKKKKKSSQQEVRDLVTQPLHFPKFVSNVLISLYDSNVVAADDDDSDEPLDSNATDPTHTSTTTPSSTAPAPTKESAAAASTILKDTFELAKHKTEIFRFFDLDGYAGSSLADVAGYGYGRNLQLKVITNARDDKRIANFWDQALVNKYGADVIQAKKKAKKMKYNKEYNVRRLSKKNVFKM